MTSVDKAAVIWTMAIVVIGVGIALLGGQLQATKSMDQEISLEQRIGEPLKKMEESMEK